MMAIQIRLGQCINFEPAQGRAGGEEWGSLHDGIAGQGTAGQDITHDGTTEQGMAAHWKHSTGQGTALHGMARHGTWISSHGWAVQWQGREEA